jgi:pantetheine-phosphate adenylyltransferase
MAAAFYSGSFDPPTFGHVDIIRRALRLFDRLAIGVGVHHGKTPLFTGEERKAMLAEVLTELGAGDRVSIVLFRGLAVNAAIEQGASVIVRGLRDAADFAYEAQMAGMNSKLAPGLETVFLTASPGQAHIAASFVRQIAALRGDVAPFVPPLVAARLQAKFPPP